MNYSKHIVIRARNIDNNIFELVFQRNALKTLPGDQIKILTEDKPVWVASGIKEPWVRVLCDKKSHSDLLRLHYPDSIKIENAVSIFPKLINELQPCFCASGTGIAVPMSYISTYPQRKVEIVYLGNRIQEEYLKARCDLKDVREEGKVYYEAV